MEIALLILLIPGSIFIHFGLAYIMLFGLYDVWDFELSPIWKLPIIIFWPIGCFLFAYGLIREWIEEVKDYYS